MLPKEIAYYQEEIHIPCMNTEGEVDGPPLERTHAHRQGLLHKGFTVALLQGGNVVCQHRRHILFDDVLDLTASSHPISDVAGNYEMQPAILATLKREWNILPDQILQPPELLGHVVYYAQDGEWIENEHCDLYLARADVLPRPNKDFAYGAVCVPLDELDAEFTHDGRGFAPWVRSFFKAGLMTALQERASL